jgi:hypothetical protein
VGEIVEFLGLTRRDAPEPVRGFTDDDIDRAAVEPEAVGPLAEFDTTDRRYEVIEDVVPER